MTLLRTQQPARHRDPTVKAQRLMHLVCERPDLDRAEKFLNDFGLATAEKRPDVIYFRNASARPFCYVVRRGPVARFSGFALEVANRGDLERLARLPSAAGMTPLEAPGGGEVVRLLDPSGFLVEAVYGQTDSPALDLPHPQTPNSGDSLPRVNDTLRFAAEPPAILKLGHVVLEVADYQATSAWYAEHFGFIPSDIEVLPDGSPAVTFYRLDLGNTPSDHHTLAIGQGFAPRYNHSAFEVADVDAVGIGQRVLRSAGYEHAWGIGRHELGSQIFDYWKDPWGMKHEHYCDGDVFTADVPPGVRSARPGGLSQWGPPVPANFIRPDLTLENALDLVRNVIKSPDLSVKKLAAMVRSVG